MSGSVAAFQARLASVMDSLARAGLCEITKLFEAEMSRTRTENETLRRRLDRLEAGQGARRVTSRCVGVQVCVDRAGTEPTGTADAAQTGSSPVIERVFGQDWSSALWTDGELASAGGLSPERPAVRIPGSRSLPRSREEAGEPLAGLPAADERWPGLQQGSGEPASQHGDEPREGERGVAEDRRAKTGGGGPSPSGAMQGPVRCKEEQESQPLCVKEEAEPQPVQSWKGPPLGSGDLGVNGPDRRRVKEEPERQAARGEEEGSRAATLTRPWCPGPDSEPPPPPPPRGPCGPPAPPAESEGAAPPLRCAHCDKSFRRPADLKRHRHTHTGERPHGCAVCGKSFRVKGSLRDHLRTHTGERPFGCAQCGRSFSLKANFKKHQRTHTGEKPYRCGHCGKGFPENIYLKIHQRTHTGEKPYRCAHCGKPFRRTTDLRRHERTHTGEKPHRCAHCGKGFSRSENLRVHLLNTCGKKT